MNPIVFKITQTGKRIALDAPNTGLTLRLSEMGIGTGKYTPTGRETALKNPVQRYPLSVAQITHDKQLVFSVAIQVSREMTISEMGLFDEQGRLFAVAATPNALLKVYPEVDFVGQYSLALDEFDVSKIELRTDPQGGLALRLMTDHIAEAHPHTQYPLKSDFDRAVTDMNEMIATKMREFSEMAEALKRQTLIPIGGVFLTRKSYTAESLAQERGYGKWVMVARGQTLVGAGGSAKLGAMLGSDLHTLTIDEMPEHKHEFVSDDTVSRNKSFTWVRNSGTSDFSQRKASGSAVVYLTSSQGHNQPHNIRQKSLVIGVWERVADSYRTPTIRVYFTSDPQGTNVINNVEQGKDAYLWVQISDYEVGKQVAIYPKIVCNSFIAKRPHLQCDSIDHIITTDTGIGILKPFAFNVLPAHGNGTHLLTKLDGVNFNAYKNPTLRLGVIDELGREFVANLTINGRHQDKNAWFNEVNGT